MQIWSNATCNLQFHKKVPSFKPRSIATPNDGMMANLYGSVEGEGTRAIWDKVFTNGPKKFVKDSL